MTPRGRIIGIKKQLAAGQLFKDNPQLAKLAGYALNFLLGFITSSARVYISCAPFGVGMVARAGGDIAGAICLAGAALGYVVTGGIEWGIRYVAACTLVYTCSFIFKTQKIYENKWFMPMVASAITAVTAALYVYDTSAGIPVGLMLFTEIVLAGGSCYFFDNALSNRERATESAELCYGVSVMILAASILMAFSQISVMGVVSIGRLAAVILVMAAAFRGSALGGCAAGAVLGLALDISQGGVPYFTMTYAFTGLISGMFAKSGRLLFLLSFIVANLISVLWTWGAGVRLEALYECFCASVIFMLLPVSLLDTFGGVLHQTSIGMGESGLRSFSARRIRRLGEAFRELYETVHANVEPKGNDNDIATVFDRAADAVCSACSNKGDCWQRNYMDTLAAMNDATPAMTARGKLKQEDIPKHFTEKCPSMQAFVTAVNSELRALMNRRQFRSRLMENRYAAYTQYADMAEILDSVAKELVLAGGPDPLAERRLLRYLRSMDIDAEASVFRDRSRRLRAVVDSTKASSLLRTPDYLDKLSAVLGVRLCRPVMDEEQSDGQLILMEAEPLAVSVGIAATRKKGETVSGDRGTYFKTEQGVLCIVLSDGMGSGAEAAKESICAVRILENFLRSGVEPATAMKILNSVLLLKNGEEWGYTTVDLLCIDLFSGEACFYKYGAAPSYVRNGKTVRRVKCESLAAGMCAGEGSAPDTIRMKLKAGSLGLVVSDGVVPEREDGWIRRRLAAWDGKDSREMARDTLQEAVNQYGCTDDMTVLAISVSDRR